MKKIFCFAIFLSIFLFKSALNVHADNDFQANYSVKYQVNENSNTRVQFTISLANKTDNFYAASYKVHVGFPNISNVRASDSQGNILKEVIKGSDEQAISVSFNERVVGVNNRLNFTISFDTPDVSKKLGRIWEINIPGLNSASEVSDFNVTVTVPPSFGNPSFIKPNIKPSSNGNSFTFTRENLNNSGISMTFGNEQIYQLNLTYHLYNKNLFPVKTEIALPPDTNYQKVQIENISPKPDNVYIDKDGNWLAQYTLSPSSKRDVIVNEKIKLELLPSASQENVNVSDYLRSEKYWEINSPEIKKKAGELKTPYDVYKFVSDFLSYDYTRVTSDKPRLGAVKTLLNPDSAVCLEFTDLFIALARASGIPAREVDGYAYTQNTKERPLSLVKDVLHAWPEYYDKEKNAWIMIDPTWAKTTGGLDYFNTLDFDHITFVRKGTDSEYPVPAGGYKLPDKKDVKDVNVSFVSDFPDKHPLISFENKFPAQIIAGFESGGNFLIKNTGEVASPPETIIINSNFLAPRSQSLKIGRIPPYGQVSVPLKYEKTPFLTNRTDEIKIIVGGNTFYHRVKIIPIFLTYWVLLSGGVIIFVGILIISGFAIKSRSLSIFGRKRENSLRGESEKSQEKSR